LGERERKRERESEGGGRAGDSLDRIGYSTLLRGKDPTSGFDGQESRLLDFLRVEVLAMDGR
jgi:hypothetical protein